jgi:acetyltransferase
MSNKAALSDLDRLFRPHCIAIVGASANDPTRMGTRTLHDLVSSGWKGKIYPVSTRHQELYGLPVFQSLRDVPQAPDVVLARTPSASMDALIDDAVSVGARFLVVLASGFAESGQDGVRAQKSMLERAARGGLRIVGPQSIGLVNCIDQLPMSLSQIMERLVPRPGRTALLTQSGAMAISLAVRGQTELGLDFSYVATFGNSADVSPIEVLHWLAREPHTDCVGLYLEGLSDGKAFAAAVQACRQAGKSVVILRSGLSKRGAQAVASHTASMSGDSDAFRAACRQLGVALCDSSESFLWTLKALSATRMNERPAVAFASISGGACALWADHAERLSLELPPLTPAQRDELAPRLPAFLTPANPMDLGPAVFDAAAFEATLQGLLDLPSFNMLVVYLFTSSPTLMGGLGKVRLLEDIARRATKPIWVIWEAATIEEWAALAVSRDLVAFRDLGQAALALARLAECHVSIPSITGMHGSAVAESAPTDSAHLTTEPRVKDWLRKWGLSIPAGMVCPDARSAQAFASTLQRGIVLKIVAAALPHKSDVGGVLVCRAPGQDVAESFRDLWARVKARAPTVEPDGVLVEELIDEPGVELFVTLRRDPVYGLVTVIGRGGTDIEVDPDYIVHVGPISEWQVPQLLGGLRCARMFDSFRGRPALAREELARSLVQLQQALLSTDLMELELNPVKLTPTSVWILDALATGLAT